MGINEEIERKFLLRTVPDYIEKAPHMAIRQGYLAVGDDAEVRLRDSDGSCTLTVKSLGGLRRDEHEIQLSREQLAALWPATAGRRLEKTRYLLAVAELHIEVDVYGGALAGLVTAEVEFDSLASAAGFVPPPWFGAELTEDPRFKNRQLALSERPPAG